MRMLATDRDRFEGALLARFPDRVRDVRESFDRINAHKDGTFAVSNVGYMLYGNGCNLRGTSSHFPAGLIYEDGETIFGLGYFSKEGNLSKHVHIIAPRGPSAGAAVREVLHAIRDHGLSHTAAYVRHITEAQRQDFLADGYASISVDPWHHRAPEEDETYPNRIFYLDRVLEMADDGELAVRNLAGAEHKRHRTKGKLAHRRFTNFLHREGMEFALTPHSYSEHDRSVGDRIVRTYFEARREQGSLVGSTPEDYWPVVHQRPAGEPGRDYFAYLGWLVKGEMEIPVALFVGERLSERRVGLYCTITLRFPERLGHDVDGHRGFTAIPQYVWLEVFKRLYGAGIREVDAGGSEVLGLDVQKRQLGGEANKTHWVVLPAVDMVSANPQHRRVQVTAGGR